MPCGRSECRRIDLCRPGFALLGTHIAWKPPFGDGTISAEYAIDALVE
jgi:hypothetical protein